MDRRLRHDELRHRSDHGRAAHDERDFEFAKQYGIPVIEVVKAPEGNTETCFTGNGTAINSGFLDGLSTPEAKAKSSPGSGKKVSARRP